MAGSIIFYLGNPLKRGMRIPLYFAIFGPNLLNFADISSYFAILGGRRNNISFIYATRRNSC